MIEATASTMFEPMNRLLFKLLRFEVIELISKRMHEFVVENNDIISSKLNV